MLMIRNFIIGIGLALSIVMSTAVAEQASDKDAAVRLIGDVTKAKAVLKTIRDWEAAYKAGDLDRVVGIMHPQVALIAQDLKAPLGHAALARGYGQAFAEKQYQKEIWVSRLDEVFAEGDTAFSHGVAELHIIQADGTIQIGDRNRCTEIFRADSNGKWLSFRAICYPEKS